MRSFGGTCYLLLSLDASAAERTAGALNRQLSMARSQLGLQDIHIAHILPSHRLHGLWFRRIVLVVLILHMSPPVVLPREPFPLRAIRTLWVITVEPLRIVVFVIDMAFKMSFGSKGLSAFVVGTFMWTVVVPCVMTLLKISESCIHLDQVKEEKEGLTVACAIGQRRGHTRDRQNFLVTDLFAHYQGWFGHLRGGCDPEHCCPHWNLATGPPGRA